MRLLTMLKCCRCYYQWHLARCFLLTTYWLKSAQSKTQVTHTQTRAQPGTFPGCGRGGCPNKMCSSNCHKSLQKYKTTKLGKIFCFFGKPQAKTKSFSNCTQTRTHNIAILIICRVNLACTMMSQAQRLVKLTAPKFRANLWLLTSLTQNTLVAAICV